MNERKYIYIKWLFYIPHGILGLDLITHLYQRKFSKYLTKNKFEKEIVTSQNNAANLR